MSEDKKWSKDDEKKPEVVKPVEIKKAKVTMINDADVVEDKLYYPFISMEPGQGFFIPNEPGQTTMQNLVKMSGQVAAANRLYTVTEVNENGDEVWEDVYVRTSTRNPDGSVKLDAGGVPIEGHDPVSRPNVIYARRYVARAVIKDDLIAGKKSDADGVLVVRAI